MYSYYLTVFEVWVAIIISDLFYDIFVISVASQHQLQDIKESRKHITEDIHLSGTSLTTDNTCMYEYIHNYVWYILCCLDNSEEAFYRIAIAEKSEFGESTHSGKLQMTN